MTSESESEEGFDYDELPETVDEQALHDFGYGLAYFLFAGSDEPESVVKRLRLAYRSVGVRIKECDTTQQGCERTVFKCPYRNLTPGDYDEKGFCHKKLDLVDDGYVSYLDEKKGLEYRRPRSYGETELCYSEVCDD